MPEAKQARNLHRTELNERLNECVYEDVPPPPPWFGVLCCFLAV